MKLLFWKKQKNQEAPVEVATTQRTKKEYIEEFRATQQVSSKPRSKQKAEPAENDIRKYPVSPIKAWCETQLTPVAWARILVRLFPIMREQGYDFTEMQKPTERTKVDLDFYILIQATIQEIYDQEYQPA